ncbi:hypothetical protein N0V93_008928 [Gnomoniopsis smithogilvyi]|uniref:Uncharacterized protein n=1 Tax=Gnomoniopsis smithogilvyi TaxID=1191159 RepID=A0A9W9CSB7_9PEZI|nr:hypothetical protein N0V93_008928 [Gnomoniopsis smithogilvyi]
MRIWRSPMLYALAAFNMAVGGFVNERQEPSLPTTTAQPTVAPVVVSTVFIQDSRPRPTDATTSSDVRPSQTPIVISSPQTPSPGAQSAQTNNTSPAAVAGSISVPQGDVVPTVMPDAPVTAFFLVLFLGLAVVYIWIISKNRHIRPTLAAVVLTFCILRVVACALRIAWAVLPENEGFRISEMISLNVGSVVIFMASAIMAKRMIRQFALTSLSGSNWRLTLWWLSKLMPIIGIVSSVAIIVLHSVGTAQIANIIVSNSTLKDNPDLAQMLVRAGIAWLFALGVLYILSVAIVVVTTRNLSRRYERLGLKLAVFFAGALLLDIGQGFRLFPMNRSIFYVTGFTLELLAASIYALTSIDQLFTDEHVDSTLARYNPWRSSTPIDLFRDDVYAIAREAQRPTTTERENGGGITIRKPLYISVDRPSDVPVFPGRDLRRPLSILSEHSEVSGVSGRTNPISEFNFPFPGPAQPTPIRRKPVQTVPAQRTSHAGSAKDLFVSTATTSSSTNKASKSSTVPGRGKIPAFSQLSPYKEISPYGQLSPYDTVAKPQRAGLRRLEQQVRRYDMKPELSDDEEDLY